MADIFISYSRRDSEHALALAERLRGAGASVWLDTAVLSAAETWSAEIVSAINTCKTFIILLSPDSVASHNVTKELSLASEKRKTIVPIVLAECTPNEAMEYALAGLQQVSLADEEALERAFAKLGITGSGFSQVVTPRRAAPKRNRMLVPLALVGILVLAGCAYFFLFSNGRSDVPSGVKTIAVLPFESLSADKENEYFTDGMTATLIDMLVSVPDLRVIDRRTSMEYKSSTLDIKSLAQALESRYLVSGRVQRQGDQVMINAEMTDTETGTVLFSKSFSGKTNDLLELQKQIAESIVVELQLAFNPDNSITFTSESRSANPQAHEWCMKADYAEEHGERDTAIAYYLQAAVYDSTFAFPYLMVARIYGNKHVDTPSPRYLILADSFLAIGTRLDTAQRHSHHMASWIASVKGDFNLAIAEATVHVKRQPHKSEGYNALGLAYVMTKQYTLAAQNFAEELKRDPAGNTSRFYLMLSLWFAHDTVRLQQYATQAIPIFEAALARRPDDKLVRNNSIPLALVWSGRGEEACKRMEQLLKTPGVDSQYVLNTAAINALSGKLERAMEIMREKVARSGVQSVDFDRVFFDNIRHFPEFKAWVKQKEALTKKHG